MRLIILYSTIWLKQKNKQAKKPIYFAVGLYGYKGFFRHLSPQTPGLNEKPTFLSLVQ